jgi:hypothetical protein
VNCKVDYYCPVLQPTISHSVVESEVAEVLGDIIRTMEQKNTTPELVNELKHSRFGTFLEPFSLMVFLQNEIRIVNAALASIERQIKDRTPTNMDGGRDGQGHQNF